MKPFDTVIDRLARDTQPDHPRAGFLAGARALADRVKAEAGHSFRIDQDAPEADQAFVIRVEAADGRRLKSIIYADEVAADPEMTLRQITMAAANLGQLILVAQGRIGNPLETAG